MKIVNQFRILITLLTTIALTACNLPNLTARDEGTGTPFNAEPLPPLPMTLIEFRLKVPADTPQEDTIFLSLLDEVTGLALNAQLFPMTRVDEVQSEGGLSNFTYVFTLPAAIGSVLKYRYERQSDNIRVAEHLADGSPVRYRLYHVTGQGQVTDIVSRWTDTQFNQPSGRIIGQVTDKETNKPIPNLLISAGGAQTVTTFDGSFRLDLLPEGVHNLVAYSMDGSYYPFQQGARVAYNSATPAFITLQRSEFVNIIFVVKVPSETPPVIPLRLAGNLFQLGNSFATLNGGMSSVATKMPVLSQLPDGRYSITLSLPVGADIRYKYTLGDGFWNAEHTSSGEYRLRQVVVPDHNTLIEDEIESWHAGDNKSITFDVTVPENTPEGDFVSLQVAPIIGWTEPIPMWRLGENRWAYILYSPLNLPGNIVYRYCRNSLCGIADDILTPGLYGAGRPLKVNDHPLALKDEVKGWADILENSFQGSTPTPNITKRDHDFWAGVELMPGFHPSWKPGLEQSIKLIRDISANMVILTPTWTYGHYYPGNLIPVLQPIPGTDMTWNDVSGLLQESTENGLSTALFPIPVFRMEENSWWESAPRDEAWWNNWFEQYRNFALYHADLAEKEGVEALILGGSWVNPALPSGVLANGSPSGTPHDALTRWQSILQEIRGFYTGKIGWALSSVQILQPPEVTDYVDFIYLVTNVQQNPQSSDTIQITNFPDWVDFTLYPAYILLNKPIVIAFSAPSSPDLQFQLDAYSTAIELSTGRDWISGVISQGFFPLSPSQRLESSIYGKPALQLIENWFPAIFGN